MDLALGHGVIESILGTDRLAVAVIELPTFAVDMDVPARLGVLIALDGAGLLLPRKL